MEIVVRSDAGEAELRLGGDHERHTLREIAECVLGHRGPTTVLVDDTHQPADRTVAEAGVRRGSVIDLCSKRPSRADTPAGRMVQVAGHGTGASIDLRDGSYRLGPTARSHARHLDIGTVTDPKVLLHVQGQLVEVEPIDGTSARLAGRPLIDRHAWTSGELVVGDRVFERSDRSGRPGRSNPERAEAESERRHLTPIPVGRSLDGGADGSEVSVDPAGGVGIVADQDDSLAILRAMVLELAMRSWPHGTALGIRTATPQAWEWTKWLAAVDTPRASERRRRPRRRHVVMIDDGTIDERRHRHPRHAVIIASARTQDELPPGLAAIVHAVGGDHAEPPPAVSVTTVADGTVTVRPEVAPYAVDAAEALSRARLHARRWPDDPDIEEPKILPPNDASSPDDLDLRAWTVARTPSALERRIERRCDHLRRRDQRPEDDSAATKEATPSSVPDAASDDVATASRAQLVGAGSIDAQRIVLPVGFWTERAGVATVPLAIGRRLAVIGGRRSDRSAMVVSLADAAHTIGPDLELFAVSPRRGPLVEPERVERLGLDVAVGPADVAAWIDRIRAATRPLVMIDGADRVGGPSFIQLAGDAFPDATIIVTLDDDPPEHHWSAPWSPNRLTIRLAAPASDDATPTAVLDSQHRPRPFRPLPSDALRSTDTGDDGTAR